MSLPLIQAGHLTFVIILSFLSQRSFCSLYQSCKAFSVVDSHLGEHLSVDFDAGLLEAVHELAVGDACTGSNPRAIDPAAMAKLLTCTYYGTEVDF